MKKTLLVALLVIPFLGISQTTKPIDGFLGIKFGSTRVAVIEALNAKGGILNKKNTTADLLYYNNIKLGHRNAGAFIVKFIDNKAFEADFIFDPGLEAKTIQYFFELTNDINDNYGAGDVKKKFQEPYDDEDDDGIKIDGIKHGKIDYVTYWLSSAKNSIAESITPELAVLLIYQDSALTDEAVKRQKTKEKSDF